MKLFVDFAFLHSIIIVAPGCLIRTSMLLLITDIYIISKFSAPTIAFLAF